MYSTAPQVFCTLWFATAQQGCVGSYYRYSLLLLSPDDYASSQTINPSLWIPYLVEWQDQLYVRLATGHPRSIAPQCPNRYVCCDGEEQPDH